MFPDATITYALATERTRELQAEAAHARLVRLVAGGKPSTVRRAALRARLGAVEALTRQTGSAQASHCCA